MDQSVSNNENLINRIQQLENERDELRKDIEQLCLQQAGPTYLAAATRMHFQRTAGLEQEIESLKKKLAACTRDNLNLQEELSEVYHIKSQLADLHSAEVSKNLEAEKQVKFFQSSVAAAFAERDNAIMEAEKAQEIEEDMTRTLNESEERVEELTSDLREAKELCASLQIDIMKLREQNENFKKVITKFYAIRESSSGVIEDMQLESQCERLLQDAPEMWSFVNHAETSTADYTLVLEKELEALRNYVDNLQNKLRMGLEIEDHLKMKVHKLEKKEILSDNLIRSKIWKLRDFYAKHKSEVIDLLEHQKTQIKSMLDIVEEQTKRVGVKQTQNFELSDAKFNDIECRDVNMDPDSNAVTEENVPPSPSKVTGKHDTSDALAQALNEKVAALLLLSQQEERHLLDRNVNAALQMKLEELQRNLLQVTNEKVMALMELSRLRSIVYGMKQRNAQADIGVTGNSAQESGGKLRSLLKKTHLSNWIGRLDSSGNETSVHLSNNEGSANNAKSNFPEDFARIKIENATLRESIESMVHLTTTIHRLRLSLLKAKDSKTSSSREFSIIEVLDDIISEAKLVKTALGSSLPVSWSLDAESGGIIDELIDGFSNLDYEELDAVTAAGFEMVELVALAAQFLKESITSNDSKRDDS